MVQSSVKFVDYKVESVYFTGLPLSGIIHVVKKLILCCIWIVFFFFKFYFSFACNVYRYLTCFVIINSALFFAGTENALIAVVAVLGVLLIVFSIVIWRLRRKLVITSSEPNLTTRLI